MNSFTTNPLEENIFIISVKVCILSLTEKVTAQGESGSIHNLSISALKFIVILNTLLPAVINIM